MTARPEQPATPGYFELRRLSDPAAPWTDEEIGSGIGRAALSVVFAATAGRAGPIAEETHYEDDDVGSFRLVSGWLGIRLAVIVPYTSGATGAAKLQRLVADAARECLTLVVLPSVGYWPLDDTVAGLSTVVPLYPADVDALAHARLPLGELIDFKLARRVYYGVAAADAQFAATLLRGHRQLSRNPDSILVPLDSAVAGTGEDARSWISHPNLPQLRRRIAGRRGVVLIGPSGSGKSVLAFQTATALAQGVDHVRVLELSTISQPIVGLTESLLLDSSFGDDDLLLVIDDLQSNPTVARYCLTLLSIARRVRVAGSRSALCTSWPEFGPLALQCYEGCAAEYVTPDQLAAAVIAHTAPHITRATAALLKERFGHDIGILKIAAMQAAAGDDAPGVRDIAGTLWRQKVAGVNLSENQSVALAVVCGSLSRYDLPAPRPLVAHLANADDSALRAATPRLLRPIGESFALGHRSTSGLIVEWLTAQGAWSSAPIDTSVKSSNDVVLAYLRELPSAAAVETLRGLQTKVGFRPEAKMARRATAVVQLWEAFSAVVQRIEHQQLLDPTWGASPGSAMFAAVALSYVGMADLAHSSISFLRTHWTTTPAALEIRVDDLATRNDFAKIGGTMSDEDKIDPQRWPDLPAADVDLDRFHRTWLTGVFLTAEAVSQEASDREHLADAVAGFQEPNGAFYPQRVAWSTARVLLGLASCGRTIDNSEPVGRAVDWLLSPRADGGACADGIWPSGTGTWNTQLEATAMVLMALIAAGVDPADERIAPARRYLLSMQPLWTSPGQELDGAVAAQAYLESGGNWEDITESAYMLSRWAQGEAFWQSATVPAQDSLAQGCRVAQIASHLVEIGWRAVAADLPAFLEALAPPDVFRRELMEEAARTGIKPTGSADVGAASTDAATGEPPAALLSTDTTTRGDQISDVLSGFDHIALDDLVVVGRYRRFDTIARTQLRAHAATIQRFCSEPGSWHRNFLLWAPPGTGKSFFVAQAATALSGVEFRTVNLAQSDAASWRQQLDEVSDLTGPVLCLIDEIDAKREEAWPYEILFPYLDLSKGKRIVLVLVGSAGEGREALVRLIQERPKGRDLVDRVPVRQRLEIPPSQLGDRLLVFVSALVENRPAAPVRQIEKLALYYMLAREDLKSSRQAEDFAMEVLSRISASQDEIYYDNLFPPGDRENQTFYAEHLRAAATLQHRFLRISTGR